MPGLPPKLRLMALIEDAMKDRAPLMHSELTTAGQLQKALTDRAEMAWDSYLTAYSKVMGADSEAQAFQLRNEAARQALDQAVEFEDSPPENG